MPYSMALFGNDVGGPMKRFRALGLPPQALAGRHPPPLVFCKSKKDGLRRVFPPSGAQGGSRARVANDQLARKVLST